MSQTPEAGDPLDLIVIFAECAHGRAVERVAVQQAHGTWTVEAHYGCAEACVDRESGPEMPVSVIDTSGKVHWSAP